MAALRVLVIEPGSCPTAWKKKNLKRQLLPNEAKELPLEIYHHQTFNYTLVWCLLLE
jgi:hypothetical protein